MLVEIRTGPTVLRAIKVIKIVLQTSLKYAHDAVYNESTVMTYNGRKSIFECPDEKFDELNAKLKMIGGSLRKIE